MYQELLLFLIGFVLLVKGADYFVKAAATIAKKLGVTEFVIGLTVVALGTSIPELTNGVIASLKGVPGIVLGDIIGSNITNIALIVGVAAMIRSIRTRKEMLHRDGYIMIFITMIFTIMLINKSLSRIEAGILLLMYIAYIVFSFDIPTEHKKRYAFGEFLDYFFKFRYITTIRSKILTKASAHKKKQAQEMFQAGLLKDFFIIVVAGGALILGAKTMIEQAIFFANHFGVSPSMIALTMIAFGTSLPELMVTISAARKGHSSIAIGNIVGSNITNICLVGGVSGLIHPMVYMKDGIGLSLAMMIVTALLLLAFLTKKHINKRKGLIFIFLYLLFIFSVFFL